MKKKLFGIIGSPVSHSLSPILHNYWFEKYNIDANYSLMHITEGNLNNVINKIRNKELSGINVTLPYKQKIIPFIDKLINDAGSTSSVNTIFLNNDNIVIGENTDVFGLQAAYLKEVTNAKNKKALVIGAGGVSSSVIFSLEKSRVKNISIINRTYEKSLFLKKKFHYLNVLEWKSLKQEISKFDIIINATSLGLKDDDDIKLDYDKIRGNKLFYDVIYNPKQTKFLLKARRLGNQTENGKLMFIYQAHQAFTIWHKIMPKIDDETIGLLDL